MKGVNLMIYSLRAIKIQEFVKLNGDPKTLIQAVVICCGRYPNPQTKQEAEDKCQLQRMTKRQMNLSQTQKTGGKVPQETTELTKPHTCDMQNEGHSQE